jgi:oxygen-independent coproporphyrinogen-3 oxidase
MYVTAIERLQTAGFAHYEISNFAQSGQESRHNHRYWAGAEYYAVGPGAARYVDGVRETNHRSTPTYLQRVACGDSPVAEREQLDDEQRAREQLIFGLRRMSGVNRHQFADQTGFEIDVLAGKSIAKFVDLGLLVDDGEYLRLSREGLLISDSLWPDLM